MTKPLQVMKFGGTSVGDAVCIGKVVEIIRTAARAARVAVVVSAMSGVTNRLIEAAQLAKAGNESAVAEIFEGLRKQHDEVIRVLIGSVSEQQRLRSALQTILAEGERQCHGTALLRELTARTLDAVSGLGERLCAPLLAAALAEAGVASEAIDATELIVTDSYHGGAEPWIDLTRSRCQTRALTLLQEDIVPVVTGFIGATEEGVVTTLGRGGSDYSATILGAALNADEVVIWSDVSGLLTADPRLVAKTSTIPEISYREAAELAYFGAKVLHPKTLRPVMDRGIPVWIRNTFAPDDAGTKITSRPAPSPGGVKAMAAMRDAALITVAGPGTEGVPDALARTVVTAAAVRADVLLIAQSSAQQEVCLVVPSALAERTVEALRHEFSRDLMHERVEHTVMASAVSVITLVGQNLRAASQTMARALAALGQENVSLFATVQGASDSSISFVLPRADMKAALARLHRELALGGVSSPQRPVAAAASPAAGQPSS
jgi:aspartate kinase